MQPVASAALQGSEDSSSARKKTLFINLPCAWPPESGPDSRPCADWPAVWFWVLES